MSTVFQKKPTQVFPLPLPLWGLKLQKAQLSQACVARLKMNNPFGRVTEETSVSPPSEEEEDH